MGPYLWPYEGPWGVGIFLWARYPCRVFLFHSCTFGRRACWRPGFSKLSSKMNGRSVDPAEFFGPASPVVWRCLVGGRPHGCTARRFRMFRAAGAVFGPRESYQEKVTFRMVFEQSSVLARSPPLRAGVQQEPAPSSDITGVPRSSETILMRP